MAYLQSPGIQIVEKNASAVTPGLSTTTGAYVGAFQWGPVMTPMLLDNETTLLETFGKPNDDTYNHFYSVSNFLSYSKAMWVVRAETGNKNATVDGAGLLIKNLDTYDASYAAGEGNVGQFAARYPGVVGSGLKVSIADSATFATWEYASYFTGKTPGTSDYVAAKGGSNDELHIIVIDALGKFTGNPGTVLEKYAFVSKASDAISYQGINNYYAAVIRNQSKYIYWMDHPSDVTGWGSLSANTVFTSLTDNVASLTTTAGSWAGAVATLTFSAQPVAPYSIGESITVTGMTPAGYNGSYIVTGCTTTTVSYAQVTSLSAATVQGAITSPLYDYSYTLSGGVDDNQPTDAELKLGWDIFNDSQTYDVSLLVSGSASIDLAAYVAMNVADIRRDCLAFVSITAQASGRGTPIMSSSSTRVADAKAFKTFDSSYTVIDSGYKYMYDKYNDKYRWVALNADVAGLCARIDSSNDPWYSPAGIVKGQIKGAIKLAWNMTQAERDTLYPFAINPVINWVGQGTMLYGDRTATLKPSAFDRINVRRLFLILEKSIANSAKYNLFEFNDQYTRLQFVATVEPFLRDVQGRRGIQEFKVICDESNNTPQVISTNQFVGTILIRPTYSINFITLNFTAVGPSVTFETAAGI